jgi:hypothetical protein
MLSIPLGLDTPSRSAQSRWASLTVRLVLLLLLTAASANAPAASVTLDDHGTAACYLYDNNNRGDSVTMHVTIVTGNVWQHDDTNSFLDLRLRDAMGRYFLGGMYIPLGAPAGTVVTQFDYQRAYPFCENLTTETWGYPVEVFQGGTGWRRGDATGSGLIMMFTNSGDGGYSGSGLGVLKTSPAQVWTIYDGFAPATTWDKPNDKKVGGDQCSVVSPGMSRYSAHAMLASLNIEDTPIRYIPPRGPTIDFTVTYNQRATQRPGEFSTSNLGSKWTFNWLSYVVDDPNNLPANVVVYVPGGGAEPYSGFNSASQSYSPDPQSHAVLVRISSTSYEKRFPDGSKQVFTLSDGSTSAPRRLFMTQWVDPAGNAATIGYDASFRITTITDALGLVTTLSYELPSDPLKITKVTEPFTTGRLPPLVTTAMVSWPLLQMRSEFNPDSRIQPMGQASSTRFKRPTERATFPPASPVAINGLK